MRVYIVSHSVPVRTYPDVVLQVADLLQIQIQYNNLLCQITSNHLMHQLIEYDFKDCHDHKQQMVFLMYVNFYSKKSYDIALFCNELYIDILFQNKLINISVFLNGYMHKNRYTFNMGVTHHIS